MELFLKVKCKVGWFAKHVDINVYLGSVKVLFTNRAAFVI